MEFGNSFLCRAFLLFNFPICFHKGTSWDRFYIANIFIITQNAPKVVVEISAQFSCILSIDLRVCIGYNKDNKRKETGPMNRLDPPKNYQK